MNVGQLKELLNEYSDETMVVISGYEGGFKDVEDAEEIKLLLNQNTCIWYYGPHFKTKDDNGTPAIRIF
jgi:hypothetical protein